MQHQAFAKPGRFFRGNLHTHSTVSDGALVKADANEPQALLSSLKAGEYYASTGPELHDMRIEGDMVAVECSPAEHIIAAGANAAARVAHGEGLTRAELPLESFREGGWVRAAVHDAAGKRAWSNPIWLEAA